MLLKKKNCEYETKCVLEKTSLDLCGMARCVPTKEEGPENFKMFCKSGFKVDINVGEICECVDPCEVGPFMRFSYLLVLENLVKLFQRFN